jgi:hypothetical protein
VLEDDSQQFIQGTKDLNKNKNENKDKINDFDLESEVKILKNENISLQYKISAMRKEFENHLVLIKKQFEAQKSVEVDAVTKFYVQKINKSEDIFNEEIEKKLEIEIQRIKKELEIDFETKIKEIYDAKQEEWYFLQEQLTSRLKIDENSQHSIKQTNKFIQEIDGLLENKFKTVLDQKTNEYERKMQLQYQEICSLRKENTQLKQKILDVQSKAEACALTANDKDSENSYIISLNQRYNDLLQSYNIIKSQHQINLNLHQPPFCSKCKAFIATSSELSKKILRLREFLSN